MENIVKVKELPVRRTGLKIFYKAGTDEIGIEPISPDISNCTEDDLEKIRFFADYLSFLRANGLKDTPTDEHSDYIYIASIYIDNEARELILYKEEIIPESISTGIDELFESLSKKYKREIILNLIISTKFMFLFPFFFALNTGKDISKFGIFIVEIFKLIFTGQELEDLEMKIFLNKLGINDPLEILTHPFAMLYLIPFLIIRTRKYGLKSLNNRFDTEYNMVNDLTDSITSDSKKINTQDDSDFRFKEL